MNAPHSGEHVRRSEPRVAGVKAEPHCSQARAGTVRRPSNRQAGEQYFRPALLGDTTIGLWQMTHATSTG